jgi:hypothetical protein
LGSQSSISLSIRTLVDWPSDCVGCHGYPLRGDFSTDDRNRRGRTTAAASSSFVPDTVLLAQHGAANKTAISVRDQRGFGLNRLLQLPHDRPANRRRTPCADAELFTGKANGAAIVMRVARSHGRRGIVTTGHGSEPERPQRTPTMRFLDRDQDTGRRANPSLMRARWFRRQAVNNDKRSVSFKPGVRNGLADDRRLNMEQKVSVPDEAVC